MEKFLFYRGIGNFAIPLEFNFNENKELKIKNSGNTDIPYVFVYESAEVCTCFVVFLFYTTFVILFNISGTIS